MLKLDVIFDVLTSQLRGSLMLMQPIAILQTIVMTSPLHKSVYIYK